MKRIHAPELEDFPWFPATLRDALTDILSLSASTLHVFQGAASIMQRVIAETSASRVIDLCAGGGGPLLSILDELEHRHGVRIPVVLTDKYPNEQAFARAEARRPGQVTGLRASVNATEVPVTLTGFRTLFNALHHFSPEQARAIFADAARKRQPIAAFEVVERSLAGALLVAGVPYAVWALTPFVRPLSLRRLALTYMLPVVPAVTAWDGFASCLRAYSVPELRSLVTGLENTRYHFEITQERSRYTPLRVTAIVGMPRS